MPDRPEIKNGTDILKEEWMQPMYGWMRKVTFQENDFNI